MAEEKKSKRKTFFAAVTGLVSAIYLINPSAGILELIPDNIPFIGNLDEAAATALLLAAIRYFGPDLTALFTRKKESAKLKDENY